MMKCPIDYSDLAMADRQGIEIDYCPQCRSVWLDRGELDKIIERTGSQSGSSLEAVGRTDNYPYRGDDDKEYKSGQHGGHGTYREGKKRKRESFLGELFGFG